MNKRWFVAALVASITLASRVAPAQETRFRFPLDRCYTGCSAVSAYVDRDPTSRVREYNCTDYSYNNHQGTDFAIQGGFRAQDEGRTIVAGADGTVMSVHDGESDRCTTGSCGGGGGFGNHVVLSHSDGKLSYYAHMRRGSILVRPGQAVRCGDAIGLVGSSGNSTGPHVHFEVREGTMSVDSFSGRSVCGGGTSLWVSQGVYRALPSEACQMPMVPTDSGVTNDVPSAPDVPSVDATSDAPVTDAGRDDVAMIDTGTEDVRVADASLADVPSDTYDPAKDWGGCNCAVTGRARGDARPWVALLALSLASIRRRQSGRFAQQRKPVE